MSESFVAHTFTPGEYRVKVNCTYKDANNQTYTAVPPEYYFTCTKEVPVPGFNRTYENVTKSSEIVKNTNNYEESWMTTSTRRGIERYKGNQVQGISRTYASGITDYSITLTDISYSFTVDATTSYYTDYGSSSRSESTTYHNESSGTSAGYSTTYLRAYSSHPYYTTLTTNETFTSAWKQDDYYSSEKTISAANYRTYNSFKSQTWSVNSQSETFIHHEQNVTRKELINNTFTTRYY